MEKKTPVEILKKVMGETRFYLNGLETNGIIMQAMIEYAAQNESTALSPSQSQQPEITEGEIEEILKQCSKIWVDDEGSHITVLFKDAATAIRQLIEGKKKG